MKNPKGQVASEYIILLAIALIVMSMTTVFVYIWPSYTYSVKKQRADDYWANSRPFAVKSNAIYPDQLVMEIENTEPVSLTVTQLWVDGTPLEFHTHSIPFSWDEINVCSGSDCTMLIHPGETKIVSTYDFTSAPQNPCLAGATFTTGLDYETDLTITYFATDRGELENQTGKLKLIGKCTAR